MKTVWRNLALVAVAALGAAAIMDPAFAEEAAAAAAKVAVKAPDLVVNKADDGWMMTSSLLVLLMTVPGLALFYGGMVRTKNMLSMLTQVLMIQCIVCVAWFVYGYSLAFTEGHGFFSGFIGSFDRLFMHGIDPKSPAATFSVGVGIDELVYVCFQMTFAAITTALAIGGFAERMKFSAVVLFAILWLTIVYIPIAHSVWFNPGPNDLATANDAAMARSGFGFQMGALDFAGGTVVHINAGVAGMVGALLLGRRIGFGKEAMPPHSLTLTMVGASLLWVGWFGFNAGSNLEVECRRGARHGQHLRRNRGSGRFLAPRRVAVQGQAEPAWPRFWRRRRPRRGNARLGLRWPDGRADPRRGGRCGVLLHGDRGEERARL